MTLKPTNTTNTCTLATRDTSSWHKRRFCAQQQHMQASTLGLTMTTASAESELKVLLRRTLEHFPLNKNVPRISGANFAKTCPTFAQSCLILHKMVDCLNPTRFISVVLKYGSLTHNKIWTPHVAEGGGRGGRWVRETQVAKQSSFCFHPKNPCRHGIFCHNTNVFLFDV